MIWVYPSIIRRPWYPPKAIQSSNLPAASKWVADVYLDTWNISQSHQVSIEKSFNSHFLLRGRSAFVQRQAHAAGWLTTVGERSGLAIRPYLCGLNSRPTGVSAMNLAFSCHFVHIFRDSFRENYRYKFPLLFHYRGNHQNLSNLCGFLQHEHQTNRSTYSYHLRLVSNLKPSK